MDHLPGEGGETDPRGLDRLGVDVGADEQAIEAESDDTGGAATQEGIQARIEDYSGNPLS